MRSKIPQGPEAPFTAGWGWNLSRVLQLVSSGVGMHAGFGRCVRLHGTPAPNSAPGTTGEPSAHRSPDLGPGDRTLAHRPARSFPSASCLGGPSCSNGSRSPGRPDGRVPEAGSPRSGRPWGRLFGHVLFLAVPSFALTLCRERAVWGLLLGPESHHEGPPGQDTIASQRPHPLVPVYWGLGLLPVSFEGDINILSIAVMLETGVWSLQDNHQTGSLLRWVGG